ncbi:MAG: VanZ family protein [Roseburia sp.]|nr:VanZ family protein [Roseburia sp.]
MKKQRILTIIFMVYLLILLRMTVFRPNMSLERLFSGTVNARLFREYIPLLRHGYWLRSLYLFGGNIVCFMPFGMYLQWKKQWKLKTIAVMGLFFSLCIEAMQYVLGTGVSELDDLILNTLGAVIGAWGVRRWLRRRCKRKTAG